MIEITGYDIVNGERVSPKNFKRRFVKDEEELNAEREKIRKRHIKNHGEDCIVCLRYREKVDDDRIK